MNGFGGFFAGAIVGKMICLVRLQEWAQDLQKLAEL